MSLKVIGTGPLDRPHTISY